MSQLKSPVLVLNKLWMPIRVITAKRALKLLFADRACIMDHEDYSVWQWEEWFERECKSGYNLISTTRGNVMLPEIIVLLKYDKINMRTVRLTKKNLFIRDQYVCQYTGKKVSRAEADIDHIIPKSRGGKNTWDNLVVCSKKINREKGDRTPEEAGLTLIKDPQKPKNTRLWIDPNMKVPDSWDKFLQHN